MSVCVCGVFLCASKKGDQEITGAKHQMQSTASIFSTSPSVLHLLSRLRVSLTQRYCIYMCMWVRNKKTKHTYGLLTALTFTNAN